MKYPKAFTSLMAGALALSLGLSACGGGSSSDTKSAPVTQTEETEEVAQDTADDATDDADATDTDDATTNDEEQADSENADSDQEIAEDAEKWTDAWMGEGSAGEYFYYAESPHGDEGIMIVLDPESNEYVVFAGTNSTDEKTGYITLTDEESGLALTYEIIGVDGDVVTIDLGEYGTAKLQSCDIDDVLAAFTAIYEGGTNALTAANDAESLEKNLRIITNGWEDAWMGESSTGELYYYAAAPGDSEDSLMLIVDPETEEYLSYIGTTTIDEETGYLVTTDDSTGYTFTYEIVEATDNGIILDAGDDGEVALGTCTMDEFIEAFVVIAQSCTPVN